MICLQFEEKILPASVVRQHLAEKIADLEKREGRAVRGKEKQSLKDEIIQILLPKAFTKKSQAYAYIDVERRFLVLNTNNAKKIERFIAFFKRAIAPATLSAMDVKKPALVMTDWLKHDAPMNFTIGLSAVLQDPSQQLRMIRCRHQDLFAQSIQTFVKEGCEIIELSVQWNDQVDFVLNSDFSIKRLQFQEAVLALSDTDQAETTQQRFDADFIIMTQTVSQLLNDLLSVFSSQKQTKKLAEVA